MSLGMLIKPARLARQLSIREAAKILGCDFTYLSKLENDRAAAPSDRLLFAMAALYDYDADTVFVAAGKAPTDLVELLRRDLEAVRVLRTWIGELR